MTEPVLVAAISAGVSMVVSILAILFQRLFELYRLRQEQGHSYAKALFDKRVEYYPQLYNYLSEYAKVIRSGNQSLENLAAFKKAIDVWNSQYSLFFTRHTSKFSAKFRFYLGKVLHGRQAAMELSAQDWENIRRLIGMFESFLKSEIGINATRRLAIPTSLVQLLISSMG